MKSVKSIEFVMKNFLKYTRLFGIHRFLKIEDKICILLIYIYLIAFFAFLLKNRLAAFLVCEDWTQKNVIENHVKTAFLMNLLKMDDGSEKSVSAHISVVSMETGWIFPMLPWMHL